MPPGSGTRTATIVPGPTTEEGNRSIVELEGALARALAERDAEFSLVEDELARLSQIYERLRDDMATVREERDRAIAAARDERERRARETLELTERLNEAMSREDAAAQRDRFVAARLSSAPVSRLPLADDALPDVPGFEVIGRIGHGGMAMVFNARRKSDGAAVAIKLLHDGADATRARTELFLREAAVMLQLDHPGLVRAFDAGECAYGLYLVMELVSGETLASRIRREGPIPELESIGIALQVARALAYCARLGLNHRDVKPSNLLLGHDGRVKLCDFGLAALASAADPARPYGSPGYASPEQLTTPTDVDERADIYGLGCTVWHMVVGRRPFVGPAKAAFDHARETDLPDPRFEGADISTRLAQVVRRMGRAGREHRYRRWDECLLDLMLVEAGNPPFAAHLADARDRSMPVTDEMPLPGTGTDGAADEGEAGSAEQPGTATITGSVPHAPPPAPPPAAPAQTAPVAAEQAISQVRRAPLPPPADPETKRGSWIVLVAAAATASAIAFAIGFASHPDATAKLCERARTMAGQGDPSVAARCLRDAALLSAPEDARRLRWQADAIEKK